MKDLLWQIPLYGLAGAMLYRLIVSPFEMWRDAEQRAASASDNLTPPSWPNEIIHRFQSDPVADQFRRISQNTRNRRAEFFQDTRDREAARLANPMPNIGIKEALGWIADRTKKVGDEARDELQDLASIGAVSVWGRSYMLSDPNPLVLLTNSIWTDHFMVARGADEANGEIEGFTQHGQGFAHRDLRFCGQQFPEHYRRNPPKRHK